MHAHPRVLLEDTLPYRTRRHASRLVPLLWPLAGVLGGALGGVLIALVLGLGRP
jgi:hypothetical protein